MMTEYPLEPLGGRKLTAAEQEQHDAIFAEKSVERLRAIAREIGKDMVLSFAIGLRKLVWIYMRARDLKAPPEVMEDLRIVRYLDKMAAGIVLIELVAKFYDRPNLLSRLATLTPEDQRRFIADEKIPLVEAGSKGDTRLVRPSEMTQVQINQLFSPEGIRTEAEQVLYLSDEAKKREAPPVTEDPFTLNRSRKEIVIHQPATIKLSQLKRWVAELTKRK
jgi:hypothetical protein